MKKTAIIIFLLVTVLGCKNESKHTSNEFKTEIGDDLTLIKGEFIYYDDAAVMQFNNEIYGVVKDDKMNELNNLVQKFKTQETDMVPVEIKGHITSKPENEEGWPLRIEIKEIINIYKPNPNDNDVIKVGE